MTVKACRYFQQVCADVRKVPGSGGGGGLPSVLGGGLLLQMGFKPMVAARGFSNKQNPCLEAN